MRHFFSTNGIFSLTLYTLHCIIDTNGTTKLLSTKTTDRRIEKAIIANGIEYV